ncbi:prepilin-type N-terminal cleavage/methylation domain-containing protein [Marinobacterium sp. MBR-109]|uniref:type IV pilus modification PilV family protein n=1 Tax=Marinobacterium sp. MBR-109 TaxID=3156462 RepID=UPI00339200A5
MELKHPKAGHNGGFTLLESMIALVIFSFALLALAGMYAKTLSLSHSTYLRALASIQAMDLEERVRANPKADDTDYVFDCSGYTAGSILAPDSFSGSESAIASSDEEDWCGNTHSVFGGLLQSAEVTSDGTDLTISIQWNERSIDENNDMSVALQDNFTYTVRK